MTGKKEHLRDYRKLKHASVVRFGNNEPAIIKGYGNISNGSFTVRKVAYVKGLEYNLVSVSQLVVGTRHKVVFDEDGSEIVDKLSNEVIIKSKRNGELYPLNMKPIFGKPDICLLVKPTEEINWLWHRRLSHLTLNQLENWYYKI